MLFMDQDLLLYGYTDAGCFPKASLPRRPPPEMLPLCRIFPNTHFRDAQQQRESSQLHTREQREKDRFLLPLLFSML